MTKLAQGARDLHSKSSQVDFDRLAATAATLGFDPAPVAGANTAAQAVELCGAPLAQTIAEQARAQALGLLRGAPVAVDVLVVDRKGGVLAHAT